IFVLATPPYVPWCRISQFSKAPSLYQRDNICIVFVFSTSYPNNHLVIYNTRILFHSAQIVASLEEAWYGRTAADIDQEMANYINKASGFLPTDVNYWTAKKANKSYGYARSFYDDANTLRTSTGSGDTSRSTLRAEMLAICPKFDDMHRIFSAQLTRNHPPS
ncbi:hypothetical protein BGX29_001555, partial [Mortierella sp. GBA35]